MKEAAFKKIELIGLKAEKFFIFSSLEKFLVFEFFGLDRSSGSGLPTCLPSHQLNGSNCSNWL